MAQYDGMALTNDGINLLAKCQLGQEIEFTKVLIGDGRVPDGKTFQEMTALANTKLALGIQSVDFVEDGRVDVTAIIDNSGLEVGFFVREIGLFAKRVGGAEVLYAYTNAGDLADYLPNAKVNEVTDQIVVQAIITNEENVAININNNFVVATKADLKKHDESVNVHVNLMDAHNADESAHEPAFTAHNADTGSHTDIRNKIGTDISSHNTSTSAHQSRFQQYLPLAGGKMTGSLVSRNVNNSYITLAGGTAYGAGGYLGLYGKDAGGNNSLKKPAKGAFFLEANDGTNKKILNGMPDGTLDWGGKPIVRSVNGVGADSNGNVDLIKTNAVCLVESVVNEDGSWYRKYSDGWLEQGGIVRGVSGYNKPVTFLKPFKDTNYTLQANHYNTTATSVSSGTATTIAVYDQTSITNRHTNTGFYFVYTSNAACYRKWYACGMGAD